MTILNEYGKLTGFTLFYNETKRRWQMSTSIDRQSWDVKHISDEEAQHLLADIDAKLERPKPDFLKGRLNFKPLRAGTLRDGDVITDNSTRGPNLTGYRVRLPKEEGEQPTTRKERVRL